MSRTLRRVMIVIAVLGIALAAYLTYVHYSGARPACTSGQTCLKVQTSVYSKVGSIPVALMGLIGYIVIFLSLIVPDREESRLAALGATLIGVCFSGYLTYRELFTLHLLCEECATSAVLLALLFVGAAWRFLLGDESGGPSVGSPALTATEPAAGGKRRRPTPAGRA